MDPVTNTGVYLMLEYAHTVMYLVTNIGMSVLGNWEGGHHLVTDSGGYAVLGNLYCTVFAL